MCNAILIVLTVGRQPSTNDSKCMGKYTQEQRKLFALNLFFFDRTFEHIAHYKPANRTKSDKMNVLLTFEEREKNGQNRNKIASI